SRNSPTVRPRMAANPLRSSSSRMSRVTSSWSGSMSGRSTISPRGTSARASLAATRSRSFAAAMPASWSPDFSSLALANTSRRSANANRSPRTVAWYGICITPGAAPLCPGPGGCHNSGGHVPPPLGAAMTDLPGPLLDGPGPWHARVQLAAYDQEEAGLVGSAAHVATVTAPVRGMISLEMLGYADRRPGSQHLPPHLIGLYPDVADFIGVVG